MACPENVQPLLWKVTPFVFRQCLKTVNRRKSDGKKLYPFGWCAALSDSSHCRSLQSQIGPSSRSTTQTRLWSKVESFLLSRNSTFGMVPFFLSRVSKLSHKSENGLKVQTSLKYIYNILYIVLHGRNLSVSGVNIKYIVIYLDLNFLLFKHVWY